MEALLLDMSKDEKKPSNPLLVFWKILSNISGILALSSLLERAFQDLVQWKGFLSTILDTYRSIQKAALDIFPFNVPLWVADYFVLGLLVNTAILSSSFLVVMKEQVEKKENQSLENWSIVFYVPMLITAIVAWPYVVYILLEEVYFTRIKKIDRSDVDDHLKNVSDAGIYCLQWLGLILLVLALFLSINTVI